MLLVSIDACRADRMSLYGYARRTTPFLEELAKRGTVFTRAFVNTLPTTQSHATILSSQYQEAHGILLDRLGGGDVDHMTVPSKLLMIQEILREEGYVTIGVTNGGYIRGDLGFSRGFDEYHDQTYGVGATVEVLLARIRAHSAAGRPIFAFLHTYEVHAPYDPPAAYRELFGHFESDFEATGENLLAAWKDAAVLGEPALARVNALYDGGIRHTDDTLRLLFEALEPTGFLRDHVLVLTSDHGEEIGDHGRLLHGPSLYDELLHVPLLIEGASVPRGRIDERLASSVDIVPTILARVGVAANDPLEGVDLLSPRSTRPDRVYSQFGNELYSMRTAEWKLIEDRRAGAFHLFELRRDPGEKSDVASSHPDLVAEYRAQIEAWRVRVATRAPLYAEDGAPPVSLDPEDRRRLKSLGYAH